MEEFAPINSTNEQAEASNAVSRKSKKLERKPLICSKQSSNNGASNVSLDMNSENVSTLSEESANNEQSQNSPLRSLKLLDGVFAPVSLSQFSSLLFLRIGFLIGNGGLFLSLGLLTAAYSILIVTVLSICAISTNGAIEGGGAYFMISRTLGPEFGGAIGIVFYIANIFSSALYTSGCVEGVISGINIIVFPTPHNVTDTSGYHQFNPTYGETYAIAFAINFLLFCFCIVGAKLFSKATVLLFGSVLSLTLIVTVTMLSIQDNIAIPIAGDNKLNITNYTGYFTGPSRHTMAENLWHSNSTLNIDYKNDNEITTAYLFGVLFSGVTGIMAGANLSGELLDPGYSIPRGTIGACGFSYWVYFILFVSTAWCVEKAALQNNYLYMTYVVYYFPAFIYIGIILATLSASMSNMIGASRVFHAIISDNLAGKNTKRHILCHSCPSFCSCLPGKEFLGPLVITFLLTSAVLAIGDMNSIAPYSSQFFLYSYAMVNFSTFMLIWAGAPNFRPQFRYYNMATCLLGFVVNLFMMFYLQYFAATLCLLIFFTLTTMIYVRHLFYPSPEVDWGSVGQAVIFHTVRKYLLKLDFRREHVKFWRPHLLLLVSNPRKSCPLIDALNDLKKSGIYILGHVKITDGAPSDLTAEYNLWQEVVDHLKIKAFVSLTEAKNFRQGAIQLVRVSGLGALKPNTVMLGFPDDSTSYDFLTRENSKYFMKQEKRLSSLPAEWYPLQEDRSQKQQSGEYVALLRDILNARKNLGLCRHFHVFDKLNIERRDLVNKSYIDVWPIDFFNLEDSRVDDTTSLFTLQMGTVLNMVSFWSKKTNFRVFLIVPREWSADLLRNQKQKVKDTLNAVRINAEIETVPFVSNVPPPKVQYEDPSSISTSTTSSTTALFTSTSSDTLEAPQNSTDGVLQSLTGSYLSSINSILKNYSKDAAITFLNIPPPPVKPQNSSKYLEALERVSDDMGPTVMVHGISKVTTTAL